MMNNISNPGGQSRLTDSFGREVLTKSYLHNYPWPESDPRLTEQPTVLKSSFHDQLVATAAGNFTLNWEDFLHRTRSLSVADRIHQLLNRPAFQFNKKEEFRQEPLWRDRIAAFVEEGRPVEIVYPLFCKIGNGVKQFDTFGPAAGEDATLLFFEQLGNLVRQLYPPGLVVQTLSDAVLYNTTFLNSPVEAGHYLARLQARVRELQADTTVNIHDFSKVLEPFVAEFEPAYRGFYAQLHANPLASLTPEDYERLLVTTRACLNTRQLGLTWADYRDVFGPQPNRKNPFFTAIDAQARKALCEQLAIKKALYEIEAVERAFPGAIRATCHKGKKSGRAILGLRAFPEYYGASKLLPYHGLALLQPDCRDGVRLVIEPEFALRPRPELTRIVDDTGRAWGYLAPRG